MPPLVTLPVRAALKALEMLLRALTAARRPGARDPTTILLDTYTPAQTAAAAALAAAPPAGPPAAARVLVLVPFRDQWPMTAEVLRALRTQVTGPMSVRVALLDNGSTHAATAAGIAEALAAFPRAGLELGHYRFDFPFNYARLNNLGVQAGAVFRPDWLCFLNNDVEIPAPDALAQLVGFAQRCPRLGALGCTLAYPNGRIQHLFAAPGVKIVAAHPFRGHRLSPALAWFGAPRPVAAVTGAAMLVAAEAFAAVGGFDEALPTVGQDIDLCLQLQQRGLVNWALPQVRMIHKEGASRGRAIDPTEVARIYAKWGDTLRWNAYYSRRLSRYSETPAYSMGEPAYPWRLVLPDAP